MHVKESRARGDSQNLRKSIKAGIFEKNKPELLCHAIMQAKNFALNRANE
jgi:hypothetical protein